MNGIARSFVDVSNVQIAFVENRRVYSAPPMVTPISLRSGFAIAYTRVTGPVTRIPTSAVILSASGAVIENDVRNARNWSVTAGVTG